MLKGLLDLTRSGIKEHTNSDKSNHWLFVVCGIETWNIILKQTHQLELNQEKCLFQSRWNPVQVPTTADPQAQLAKVSAWPLHVPPAAAIHQCASTLRRHEVLPCHQGTHSGRSLWGLLHPSPMNHEACWCGLGHHPGSNSPAHLVEELIWAQGTCSWISAGLDSQPRDLLHALVLEGV